MAGFFGISSLVLEILRHGHTTFLVSMFQFKFIDVLLCTKNLNIGGKSRQK